MRSPPIVKTMYRLIKDNDVRRAKARARLAAKADTKAKARVSGNSWIHGCKSTSNSVIDSLYRLSPLLLKSRGLELRWTYLLASLKALG